MKKGYLLLLILGGCSLFQSGLRDRDYEEIAPAYCECLQTKVGPLDPYLVTALERAAVDDYFDIDDYVDSLATVLSDRELKYFGSTIERLEELVDEEDIFESCYQNMVNQWPRTSEVDMDEFEIRLLDYLSKDDCYITRLFIEVENS